MKSKLVKKAFFCSFPVEDDLFLQHVKSVSDHCEYHSGMLKLCRYFKNLRGNQKTGKK